jgi:hypothetical protein
MDIDSSICINDRSTLNTSKINTIRQTTTQIATITATAGISNSPPNNMQFQPSPINQQQHISSDSNSNDIDNSLHNNNNSSTGINDDSLVNNKYENATEQVIFDSIFANDSGFFNAFFLIIIIYYNNYLFFFLIHIEFQAFLEVLEKKDSDPRIVNIFLHFIVDKN